MITQSQNKINIYWNNKILCGNNQNILLEQLEEYGILIPYSCRSGICGCCSTKIIKGKVKLLKNPIIKEDGKILVCICIPQTSIFLLS